MSTKVKNILTGIIVILVLAVLISGCVNYGSRPVNDTGVSEFNASGDRNMTSIFGINISPRESGVPLSDLIHTYNSVELCLNSRLSYHEEWRGSAPDEWLAHVLWAAGRAPVTGSYRDIYVTLPRGRYQYDLAAHSLINGESGHSSDAAFILSFDRELDFDAGAAYMFATLASVSLWNGTGSQLVSCPIQENLFFGIRDVGGLTDELAVTSSDGSLPDPEIGGSNSFEDVMANLKYIDNFTSQDISREDLSQILWAGYGCTPHTTYNGRGGLTVPSWRAEYYLTGNIYVVDQDGVFRYHNRNPDGDLTTRDHRLERIQTGDVRDGVRFAIRDLPDAPCYVVLCLDNEDVDKWYARLETGFVGGNMLLQGSALGMGCWFTTELTSTEQGYIQKTTGIGKIDVPHAIVSIGHV